MKDYMFVIRFRLPPRFQAKIADHQISDGSGQQLAVSQNEYAIHLRSVDRFETEEEAQAALDKTLCGLSILGVLIGYGVDDFRSYSGDSRAPSPVENLRVEVLLDESDLNLEGSIQMLNTLETVAEKYKRAANFYDDSMCVKHQTDALVLRTTGLEVLSQRESVDESLRNAVDEIMKYTKTRDFDETIRERILNSLGQRKTESIGEAVRRHLTAIVPEVPQDVITRIYGCRSQVVHGDTVEIQEVNTNARNAATLLRYCILRELGFSLPEPTFQR